MITIETTVVNTFSLDEFEGNNDPPSRKSQIGQTRLEKTFKKIETRDEYFNIEIERKILILFQEFLSSSLKKK